MKKGVTYHIPTLGAHSATIQKALLVQKKIAYAVKHHSLQNEYASVVLPFQNTQHIQTIKKIQNKLKPELIVVIGIGGSNLGSQAISEAKDAQSKLIFADTVDSLKLVKILKHTHSVFERGKSVVYFLISKSGTTTESIANFDILLQQLKSYRPHNYHQFVNVITDEGSLLESYAHSQKYHVHLIPRMVGGRFSVFSNVGLLPLACDNCDVDALLNGAQAAVKTFLHSPKNHIIASAIYRYGQHVAGKKIQDMFFFAPELESIGKWYRQLFAESLGKKTRSGITHIGITPTVSIGSTDLHSMGQLYFGGAHDKLLTIVNVASRPHLRLSENVALLPFLNKLKIETIMNAIVQGVKKACDQQSIAHIDICLYESNEYSLGYFMQSLMLEVMILGELLDVNTFDQPDVESYKQQTRKILDGL